MRVRVKVQKQKGSPGQQFARDGVHLQHFHLQQRHGDDGVTVEVADPVVWCGGCGGLGLGLGFRVRV
jgi:hypothetical protein